MEKFTKGHNWGVPVLKDDTFQMVSLMNEKAVLFDFPLKKVRDVQGAGKEVTIGFVEPDTGAEGVTEIRFHCPPNAVLKGDLEQMVSDATSAAQAAAAAKRKDEKKPDKKKDKKGSDDDSDSDSDDDEDDSSSEEETAKINPAQVLLQALKSKCQEDISGKPIAQLHDVNVLSPKARLDFDLFKDAVRIRGARYSWIVNYPDIQQMFLLPAPDLIHRYFVIALNKPLKQAKQSIYHLVMSFEEQQVIDESEPFALSITDEELAELNKKDGPKLTAKMAGPVFEIVAKVFKSMSNAKVIGPSKFSSHFSKEGATIRSINCSLKASPGSLFPLEKSLFFLPKPCTYVRNEEVRAVKFRNVGQRFFDVAIVTKAESHELQSVDKNEYAGFVEWLRSKDIKMEGTKEDIIRQQVEALGSSDSEEDDEDFDASGSSSDDDDDDGDADEGEDDDDDEEPKKKKHKSDKKKEKSKDKKHKEHKKHKKHHHHSKDKEKKKSKDGDE